jgi:hypothetical protein
MNPRQPGLSCVLFPCRQALTRSTFGISALHRRNASPVHARCPSEASAAVGSTKTASAVASIKLSWKFPDRMATMNPPGRGLGKEARRRIRAASLIPKSLRNTPRFGNHQHQGLFCIKDCDFGAA